MYNPAAFFSKKDERQETAAKSPLQYRARTFSDVAVRVSQSHKGVPAIAPRTSQFDLCRRCGEQRADHRQKSSVRACPRFQSLFSRARKPLAETMNRISEGDATMQKTTGVRRMLLTRKTTPQDIGLSGGCEEQASTLFESWKLLTRGHDVGTIVAATGLKAAFISAMADLFEG
jgi:hypothetical protein